MYSTLKLRGLIIICAFLLIGYWLLMTFFPVPGIGAGNFEEGANLANYIDKQYLPLKKYDGDHDPEGLLSTLPAISTCLLGVFVGMFIKNDGFSDQEKVKWLIVGGFLALLFGFLWGIQFPVIKKIWTSSYVLVTAGYSTLLLASFYQIIEIWRVRVWAAPFIWIGMNAILIYLISGLVGGLLFYSGFVPTSTRGVLGDHAELLASLLYAGMTVLIAYLFFRSKKFIRF